MKKKQTMQLMRDSLEATIQECLKNPELIQQYERLHPKKVYATEKKNKEQDEKWAYGFFNFIRDYIWMPLITKKID